MPLLLILSLPMTAVGAMIGGSSNLAWQIGVEGKNMECVDWGQVGSSAVLGGLMGGFSDYGSGLKGYEPKIGNNARVNPWGNPKGQHWYERMPHYHLRSVDPVTGKTIPGKGWRWHRPWQKGLW